MELENDLYPVAAEDSSGSYATAVLGDFSHSEDMDDTREFMSDDTIINIYKETLQEMPDEKPASGLLGRLGKMVNNRILSPKKNTTDDDGSSKCPSPPRAFSDNLNLISLSDEDSESPLSVDLEEHSLCLTSDGEIKRNEETQPNPARDERGSRNHPKQQLSFDCSPEAEGGTFVNVCSTSPQTRNTAPITNVADQAIPCADEPASKPALYADPKNALVKPSDEEQLLVPTTVKNPEIELARSDSNLTGSMVDVSINNTVTDNISVGEQDQHAGGQQEEESEPKGGLLSRIGNFVGERQKRMESKRDETDQQSRVGKVTSSADSEKADNLMEEFIVIFEDSNPASGSSSKQVLAGSDNMDENQNFRADREYRSLGDKPTKKESKIVENDDPSSQLVAEGMSINEQASTLTASAENEKPLCNSLMPEAASEIEMSESNEESALEKGGVQDVQGTPLSESEQHLEGTDAKHLTELNPLDKVIASSNQENCQSADDMPATEPHESRVDNQKKSRLQPNRWISGVRKALSAKSFDVDGIGDQLSTTTGAPNEKQEESNTLEGSSAGDNVTSTQVLIQCQTSDGKLELDVREQVALSELNPSGNETTEDEKKRSRLQPNRWVVGARKVLSARAFDIKQAADKSEHDHVSFETDEGAIVVVPSKQESFVPSLAVEKAAPCNKESATTSEQLTSGSDKAEGEKANSCVREVDRHDSPSQQSDVELELNAVQRNLNKEGTMVDDQKKSRLQPNRWIQGVKRALSSKSFDIDDFVEDRPESVVVPTERDEHALEESSDKTCRLPESDVINNRSERDTAQDVARHDKEGDEKSRLHPNRWLTGMRKTLSSRSFGDLDDEADNLATESHAQAESLPDTATDFEGLNESRPCDVGSVKIIVNTAREQQSKQAEELPVESLATEEPEGEAESAGALWTKDVNDNQSMPGTAKHDEEVEEGDEKKSRLRSNRWLKGVRKVLSSRSFGDFVEDEHGEIANLENETHVESSPDCTKDVEDVDETRPCDVEEPNEAFAPASDLAAEAKALEDKPATTPSIVSEKSNEENVEPAEEVQPTANLDTERPEGKPSDGDDKTEPGTEQPESGPDVKGGDEKKSRLHRNRWLKGVRKVLSSRSFGDFVEDEHGEIANLENETHERVDEARSCDAEEPNGAFAPASDLATEGNVLEGNLLTKPSIVPDKSDEEDTKLAEVQPTVSLGTERLERKPTSTNAILTSEGNDKLTEPSEEELETTPDVKGGDGKKSRLHRNRWLKGVRKVLSSRSFGDFVEDEDGEIASLENETQVDPDGSQDAVSLDDSRPIDVKEPTGAIVPVAQLTVEALEGTVLSTPSIAPDKPIEEDGEGAAVQTAAKLDAERPEGEPDSTNVLVTSDDINKPTEPTTELLETTPEVEEKDEKKSRLNGHRWLKGVRQVLSSRSFGDYVEEDHAETANQENETQVDPDGSQDAVSLEDSRPIDVKEPTGAIVPVAQLTVEALEATELTTPSIAPDKPIKEDGERAAVQTAAKLDMERPEGERGSTNALVTSDDNNKPPEPTTELLETTPDVKERDEKKSRLKSNRWLKGVRQVLSSRSFGDYVEEEHAETINQKNDSEAESSPDGVQDAESLNESGQCNVEESIDVVVPADHNIAGNASAEQLGNAESLVDKPLLHRTRWITSVTSLISARSLEGRVTLEAELNDNTGSSSAVDIIGPKESADDQAVVASPSVEGDKQFIALDFMARKETWTPTDIKSGLVSIEEQLSRLPAGPQRDFLEGLKSFLTEEGQKISKLENNGDVADPSEKQALVA